MMAAGGRLRPVRPEEAGRPGQIGGKSQRIRLRISVSGDPAL